MITSVLCIHGVRLFDRIGHIISQFCVVKSLNMQIDIPVNRVEIYKHPNNFNR